MADEGFKRKLTAILSADVIGYSRLMRDDEEATVRDLAAHRVLIADIIQQHNGRVVDSPGDNILAEFASVVDAVNGAIKIQEEIKRSNADTPEDRRMEFRIGINLGDVIEEDERIYGDGVNIAARVEGLAAGGGIAISGTVYEHIKEKLSLGYQYLGEQNVKNISEPVRVYRLLTEPADVGKMIDDKKPKSKKLRWVASGAVALIILVVGTFAIWNYYFRPSFEPASVEKMAFPLPEKPSIAVLPFDNLSVDPEQDYIADGFTENIITGLSQIPEMFVIARNSVFTYKGKPVNVKKVSEELGVKYVLEGSIQKSGDRLRVNAQLIDALKGHHLWAERYDRELKDLFKLQDEITIKILNALQIKLVLGGDDLWYRTENFEVWSHLVKGAKHFDRFTKDDNRKAREHFEQATKLDPDYGGAWAGLAWTHLADVWLRSSDSPKESIKQALKIAEKTSKGWSKGEIHDFMSRIYYLQRHYDKAVAEAKKAVDLVPNSSRYLIGLADVLNHAARPEEAIVYAKRAMRLEPYYPAWFQGDVLAVSYAQAGRHEEVLEACKQVLERALKGEYSIAKAHRRLAGVYASLNRMEEARAHRTESLKIDPNFFVDSWRKKARTFFKNQSWIDRSAEMLLKAGFPEHPPLKLPDKPSIAVLAFDNLSDDPSQEYFADGLSEEIITALSKTSKLFVIARNSSFIYKGKPVKVQQIGLELGVKYVLEGSVRKADDRVRITAQLVDAKNGNHMWADRYDRKLKDLFALQDDITMKVITALEVKLTEGEQARITGSGTNNLNAYLKVLQARDLKRHQTIESNHKARRLVEEAIKIDPDYAQAYRWLSGTYLIDVWLGSTESPQESLKTAAELSKKALSLDDSLGGAHGLLGNIYIMRKDYEKGIREAKWAVELEPNGADAHAFLGMGLLFADSPEEAIPILKKAMRLDPNAPEWYMHVLAAAYRDIEKYEQAMEWGEKAVQKNPNNVLSRKILCSIYSLADRMDEARAQAKEIMRLNPNISVERIAKTDPQKNQVVKKRYIDALRKAGLPD